MCERWRVTLWHFQTIRRLVVVYSRCVEGQGRIFDEIRAHTDVDISGVSELEIIKCGLAGGLGLDEGGDGDDERMLDVILRQMKGGVRRVRLSGVELSAVGFLRLLQLEGFSGLERLELEDCEFEGIRRTRVLDGRQKVSIESVRELFCIRTDTAFAKFCPNLKVGCKGACARRWWSGESSGINFCFVLDAESNL